MKAEIATFLIPRDMRELGYEEQNYIATYMDYVCKASMSIRIKGDNEFFYLIGEPQGISISSAFGIYDLSDTGINKQQHIHQGKIIIQNNTSQSVFIKFIHVIPKYK
jgi:hypothetical protein